MSNEEKQEQLHYFKKVNQIGVRISLMQLITIFALAFSGITWYNAKDEKSTIDGAMISVKIDNLAKDIKLGKSRDSLQRIQDRLVDSLALAFKFNGLKESIDRDISPKFVVINARIDNLEKRINVRFVQEVKQNGKVFLKPVDNK